MHATRSELPSNKSAVSIPDYGILGFGQRGRLTLLGQLETELSKKYCLLLISIIIFYLSFLNENEATKAIISMCVGRIKSTQHC